MPHRINRINNFNLLSYYCVLAGSFASNLTKPFVCFRFASIKLNYLLGTKHMRHSPYLAAAAATLPVTAVATPGSASLASFVDFGGVSVTCADNTACDSNSAVGVLQINPGLDASGVRAAVPQSVARDRLGRARAMVRGLAVGREG
jgi:hypothetical protein